jgi:hypothetical protein
MHVIVPLAQTPLQQSLSNEQPVSFTPQVFEQTPAPWSQPPLQQSLSTKHVEPADLQEGVVVVVDPPPPALPVLWPALVWMQKPLWQLATEMQSPSPLHGASISAFPLGGGAQVPLTEPPTQLKLAHSES